MPFSHGAIVKNRLRTCTLLWYGFTGERQDSTNGLTYLRARYYNPALGRFLTPDSLIPDVTNGQALNVYAYVYNDPINLVDPSGHIGIWPVMPTSIIKFSAQKGLDFLDWWNNTPDDCDCDFWADSSFWGPPTGVVGQGIWGAKSQPAAQFGTFTIEARFDKVVPQLWRKLPGMESQLANKIIPKHWGYKTVTGPWETWSRQTGWIDDIVGPGLNKQPGVHNISDRLRYGINSQTKLRPRSSPTGFAGAAAIAAWIDGIIQLISDAELCLSPLQRANRFALSLLLGLAAGAAAGIAFAAVAGPATVSLTAIAAGWAAGFWASNIFDKTIRQPWYEKRPNLFGT